MRILVVLALLFTNRARAFHLPAEESQADGRILNGTNADETQFPYLVYLKSEANYCSGALIGEEWVVTAAHCVSGRKRIDVYFGMTYWFIHEVAYGLASDSIVVHADYNKRTLANDIALIKIPLIHTSNTISPVALPALIESHSKYVRQDAFLSGWGRNGQNGAAAQQLQWTLLPVITNEECEESYGKIAENEMCASTDGGTSACLGDSGGPLVLLYKYKLIGIFSAGSSRSCEDGAPIIFTRITSHLHWIKNFTGIWY